MSRFLDNDETSSVDLSSGNSNIDVNQIKTTSIAASTMY